MPRLLSVIAAEIRKEWPRVSPHAEPYLRAFATLDNVRQSYGAETGKVLVSYFLANAQSWRGDAAKRIKRELKSMVD